MSLENKVEEFWKIGDERQDTVKYSAVRGSHFHSLPTRHAPTNTNLEKRHTGELLTPVMRNLATGFPSFTTLQSLVSFQELIGLIGVIWMLLLLEDLVCNTRR